MPLMPTFWQSVLFWLKMGLLSFGGPAGQIALMHKELVEDKRWISENRFLHALNYCMILTRPRSATIGHLHWLVDCMGVGVALLQVACLFCRHCCCFGFWAGCICALVNCLPYKRYCGALSLLLWRWC
jgi:hypothetical protein